MRPGPARRDYRFSRTASSATQYWSLHPLGPLAETLRWRGIRDPEFARELRVRIWAGRIASPPNLLHVTFDTANDAGIAPDALVDDDYEPCQDWADDLRGRDTSAVIVPSAALPGTENLVLFGPRIRIPFPLEPIDLDLEVPTDPVAEGSQAPPDLLRLVRWKGAPHQGLESCRAGEPLVAPEVRVVRLG